MAVSFLENNLLADSSLKFFEYSEFKSSENLRVGDYMIMDSQAIENLEVTECLENGVPQVEGSLLEFVDHTKTPFGKRQIRRWLLSPLLDPVKIHDRLNAVDDLMSMPI